MTGAGLSALVCTCLAALFEVHSFPLTGQRAQVFLANADMDKTADIFVLDDLQLTAYPSAANYAPVAIPLAENTSAFDIADLDGDGKDEVIAVRGDSILCYTVPAGAAVPLARELFTLQTRLGPSQSPYPQVIVVKHDGRSLLALPCAGSVELRSADGALVSRYDAIDKTRIIVSDYGWPRRRPEGVDLQVWVSSQTELKTTTADAPFAPSPEDPWKRMSRVAVFDDLSQVPRAGFPLKTDGTTLLRAVCVTSGRHQSTTVRIREVKSEEDDFLAKNITLGPERKYPGEQVGYDGDYPDFNGDGYVDLTLWKAPTPGMSVDTLTRAITRGVWPLEIVFHLFSPVKMRFEPTPWSRIALTAPVRWFLESAPIRNAVLCDLNSDKRTDVALSDTDHSFAVWLSTEKGFARSPDFRHTCTETIEDVAFHADLDGDGRTSIGLRTAKNLYLLKPCP